MSSRTPTTHGQRRGSIQTIPLEALSMIFAMSDKPTCAAACLVSRRWRGVAMNELWRSLPSLLPLFQLLGPLADSDTGYDLHPDCVSTAQSWHLFRSHAPRVQSLTHNELDFGKGISTGLILRTLAVHSGGILPNLRAVHWDLYISRFNIPLAFCPPSLERMSLHIGNEDLDVDSVKRLLCGLSSSLANRLKFFEFGTDASPAANAALTTALKTFLKSQSDLLELKLTEYDIQDPVILEGDVPDDLRSIGYEERFIAMYMEPILQLSGIEDIRLWLGYKLELKLRDIQQMGQAWKGLKSLILLPEGPGILFSHLVTFAQWFPVLQQFAARFDCNEGAPPADDVPSRFKSLRRLTLLDAKIPYWWQLPYVAGFLVAVCGPKVEVRHTTADSLDTITFLDDLEPWKVGDKDEELQDWMDAFYRGPGKPMSSRTPTTQRRASIQTIPPEVMSMIFAMSDKPTCAAACLVCRRWSGAAMDELWRSLPSLLPLFELLGPLFESDTGYDLAPDCVLTAQSWDLFRSYAQRIQSLTHDESYDDVEISIGLIVRALEVHPGGILPNLRAVHWELDTSELNHPLAFCPPSLERMSLHIYYHHSSVDSVKRLFCDLSSSLANRLRFFEFGTQFSGAWDATITTAMTNFLKSQSGLVELKLPNYEIQDPVIVSEVCQTSLQLRTFCAEVGNMTKELFRVALDALARRGASLRRVRLIWARSESREGTICLADMEPILKLFVIEDIRLWLGCKLELKVRDIQLMGQAWRGLKSLILLPAAPGIPLPHLATFAQWFPVLQQFAARFDCEVDPPSADEVPSRFKSLRRLILLDAEIPDWQLPYVAEFLVVVCGPKVEVISTTEYSSLDGITFLDDLEAWEVGYEDEELQARMDAFYRVHEAIKKMD
ncbi:hypothetical protein M407DRAFT_23981 [Tulasnella calospora MUT 4182]|uniref:F-box domain-containing protein n=1 Tax=Tulasnella calospora MUT 4182 TaxID=1051891 RepID=A0A0C3Q9P6_9AGAM|nr:hypothetical protein M407DRAFT_23981 [Tulasnella calospora MUT 4182]